ncbi:MAG: histidine kinase [Anaerolineae bacterium]|nr:histidine kinase [Anaerolineae bacterium]
MNSAQFDISPYTFNALALVIVGLAGSTYLLQLEQKTAALRFYILGVISFTIGMLAFLFNSIVLWGGALTPFADACLVLCMASLTEFVCRYPCKISARETLILRLSSTALSLAALSFSFYYAWMVLGKHIFFEIPFFFRLLNPAASLLALSVSLRHTFLIQRKSASGKFSILEVFFKPQNRPARVLFYLSIGLFFASIQALSTIFELNGWLPPLPGVILKHLALLLMVTIIVYASFGFTPQQPSLVVRLVGLSLITLLTALEGIGLYNVNFTIKWIMERNLVLVNDVRNAISFGQLDNMPDEMVYLITRYPDKSGNTMNNLLYSNSKNLNVESLLPNSSSYDPPSTWEYFLENNLLSSKSDPSEQINLRYGEHTPGSYHQYAAYIFKINGREYEAGFSLDEMNNITRSQCSGLTWSILGSSIFVLFVFPLFFQSNLIRPLERLLKGVRLADGGNLNMRVVVSHNDEIGYLTTAFNKMIASLNQELEARQKAETELRQLSLFLEDRVQKRTHELETLYNVITASNLTSGDSQTLLNSLLERSLDALSATSGFILLFTEDAYQPIHLAASHTLPEGWEAHLTSLSFTDEWLIQCIMQNEPFLITDTHRDERAPVFMQMDNPLTVVFASLQSEGHVLGILGIARPAEISFSLDEAALLVSIVNQVAVVVHTDQLRQLVQQAVMIEERQRLARDLHDSVTQSLYGLVTFSEVGLMKLESGKTAEIYGIYQKIGQMARQAIREMRLFLHQSYLPELEQDGLIKALNLRLTAVEGRADIKAQLMADESIHLALPVETAFYYIAQEALNNSLKHAHASQVTVSLQRSMQSVIMEITDNGQGFDLQNNKQGGMGLGNMQARALEIGALLNITSHPGTGTRVTISLEV